MNSPTDPRSSSQPVSLNTTTAGLPPASLVPRAAAPGIGSTVGTFRLDRELGRGGMGVVYAATDEVLHRTVALKLMSAECAADETYRARFLREGRSVAVLKSDHIVQVHTAGEHNGQLYLAMEYIEGPTLDAWLKGRAVSVADVLWVANGLLAGLAAAHARDLIHRDVKPGNAILEESTGRLKLLDFGLVRDVSARPGGAQATATVGPLGTPAYMSPEQAREQKLDARTDLFSAGVVLYRLVLGKSPFARDSVTESMCAVLTEPPPPLTGVPPALSAFVARLMAYNPDDRPRDAGAALAELRALERELARAPVPTEPEIVAAPEPARRGKLPLALGGLAVLLAVVAAVLLGSGKPRDEGAQGPPPQQPPGTPPEPKGEPKPARPLAAAEVLKLIVADIDAHPGPKATDDKPTRLYLFAPHLAPGSDLAPGARAAYRAAARALFERRPGVRVRELGADKTVFAVELSAAAEPLDGLLTDYPYGLTFERPESLRRDDELARAYTGPVAFVRFDWFASYLARRAGPGKRAFGADGPEGAELNEWARAWSATPVALARAAEELGADPEQVKAALARHAPLTKTYGTAPLLEGKSVPRARWESVEFATSAFQELARELGAGVPVLTK